MKKAVLFAMCCTAIAFSASHLYAACSAASPTPIGHFLTGYLDCDDTGRVQGFIYQLTAPATTNSGPLNVSCASAAGPSLSCTGSSPGDVGDHHLTIETDATTFGWNGCPVTTAPNRIVAVAIDSIGNGAILTVSGKDPNFGYFLEMAHPTSDAGATFDPISCTTTGRPRVLNVSNNGSTVNISLNVPAAVVHSDCDPNSLGKAFTDQGVGTICDGFVATPAQGHLYTSTQPCATPDLTLSKWAATAVTPDAAGNALVSGPSPTTTGTCLFIAGSSTLTGSPEFLTGFVSVGQLASPPRAENLSASSANGKVTIRWSTSTEVGLATFKILAESKAKGTFEVATVAPKGNGGAANYSVSLGMGDSKGGRSAIVRAVQTDGTFIDSAAVNF